MLNAPRPRRRNLGLAGVAATLAAVAGLSAGGVLSAAADRGDRPEGAQGPKKAVKLEMLAPENGDRAGIGSRGFFVDLEAEFDAPLEKTGFTGLQLTGPGAHNNVPPFPGTFSRGQDDRFPGLIVLLSTTQTEANGTPTGFTGPGQNVANLFNLTGVTDRSENSTELWATWIVGAPLFGRNTPSTAYGAIAADKNGDGIYNDAPNSVPDADADGDVDQKDLKTFGTASNVEKADFFIRD
jgi:hypothetical protein